jgi:hypothetical protein
MRDYVGMVVVVEDDWKFRPPEVPRDDGLRGEHLSSGLLVTASVTVCFFPTEHHETSHGFGEVFSGGFLFCWLCRLFLLHLFGRWLGDETL